MGKNGGLKSLKRRLQKILGKVFLNGYRSSKMFPCKRCGGCCRKIGKVFFAKNMVDENGVCKYLDHNTNLCSIYDRRPIFCNVDKYYDSYLCQQMTREEFYKPNLECCKKIAHNVQEK